MIAMLTLPNFNMLATTGFLDPFRAANYLNRGYFYDWQFVSPHGGAVVASNGMVIAGTEAISQHEKPADIVVISASWTPEEFASPAILAWLRRQERRGAMLGGIDTGAFILGYGGLLNNHAASVHFEHHASFREIFPAETLSPLPFSIDARRFSSAGGTAATDLGLGLLAMLETPEQAREAAAYLYHQTDDRSDGAGDATGTATGLPETVPVLQYLPPKLQEVIRLMRGQRENVLAIEAFAARVRLSQRQLERQFKTHLKTTPVKFYLKLRLDYARSMVTQTNLSMIEIAVACGFTSQEHFSRSYRKAFGLAPSADRQVSRIPFQLRDHEQR